MNSLQLFWNDEIVHSYCTISYLASEKVLDNSWCLNAVATTKWSEDGTHVTEAWRILWAPWRYVSWRKLQLLSCSKSLGPCIWLFRPFWRWSVWQLHSQSTRGEGMSHLQYAWSSLRRLHMLAHMGENTWGQRFIVKTSKLSIDTSWTIQREGHGSGWLK